MTVTIVVIDGFGVGAMPDAGELRATDIAADTFGHIAQWRMNKSGRPLWIPWMTQFGLANLRSDLAPVLPQSRTTSQPYISTVRRASLGYPGADTFAGHQTMMGADMSSVVVRRLADELEPLRLALNTAGHTVRLFEGKPLLIVDGSVLVHDNLEADPGLNWNVSAKLDEADWDEIVAIANVVRSMAPVGRVIAVGGYSEHPLTDFVRPGEFGTIGVDTPASGFYTNEGLRVQHLGIPIDHKRQLPQLAADAGLNVTLIGKAADILAADSPHVVRRPGVNTDQLLSDTTQAISRGGLIVTNIQQTDLAGHQQDTAAYAQLVERVDAALPKLLSAMRTNDLLVITGDHGNDPTIGHAFHTREYTPVLAIRTSALVPSARPRSKRATVNPLMDFESLADIGASVASLLGLNTHRLETGIARQL